jgi:tetratricopeptide (TPR) repeat protein
MLQKTKYYLINRWIVKLLLLLSVLLISSLAIAGDSIPGKLRKFQKENDWHKKAAMLIDICLESESANYMDIKKEAHKLIVVGKHMRNKQIINSSSFVLAFILSKQGNPDLSLKLLHENESYFTKIQDYKNLAYVRVAKGHCNYYIGLPKEAIEEYKEAVALWENENNKKEVNLSNSFIATALIQLGKLEEAKVIFKECIDYLLPFGKNRTISSYYSQLGEIYSAQNNTKESIYYFDKGSEFAYRSGDPGTIARAYNYLAISNYYSGDIEKALLLFQLSLNYRIKSKDMKLVCESYYNIASLYQDEKKYDLAEENFFHSITQAKKNRLLVDEADALLALSDLYKGKMEYKKSLEFMADYVSMKEKIFNQEEIESTNENVWVELINQSRQKEESYARETLMSGMLKKEKSKSKYILSSGLFVLLGLILFFVQKNTKKTNSI